MKPTYNKTTLYPIIDKVCQALQWTKDPDLHCAYSKHGVFVEFVEDDPNTLLLLNPNGWKEHAWMRVNDFMLPFFEQQLTMLLEQIIKPKTFEESAYPDKIGLRVRLEALPVLIKQAATRVRNRRGAKRRVARKAVLKLWRERNMLVDKYYTIPAPVHHNCRSAIV